MKISLSHSSAQITCLFVLIGMMLTFMPHCFQHPHLPLCCFHVIMSVSPFLLPSITAIQQQQQHGYARAGHCLPHPSVVLHAAALQSPTSACAQQSPAASACASSPPVPTPHPAHSNVMPAQLSLTNWSPPAFTPRPASPSLLLQKQTKWHTYNLLVYSFTCICHGMLNVHAFTLSFF
jgi:hypothetical protein